MAGLEVLGRDKFGVFPLRGKLLNVREASGAQLRNNKELMNLCTILGLSFDKKYAAGPDETMRYGKVMIMTDQDHDGSHIKGLLINFFHHFWPNLLKSDAGFLQQFATPVLKATRLDGPTRKQLDKQQQKLKDEEGGNSSGGSNGGGAWSWREVTAKRVARGEAVAFYSTRDYEKWAAAQRSPTTEDGSRISSEGGQGKGKGKGKSSSSSSSSSVGKWKIKFYKGLGTSTAAEAKEYFSDLDRHRSTFTWQYDDPNGDGIVGSFHGGAESGEDDSAAAPSTKKSKSKTKATASKKGSKDIGVSEADDLIDMVFNKARAEDRREWLLTNGREQEEEEAHWHPTNASAEEIDLGAAAAAAAAAVQEGNEAARPSDSSAVVSYADFVNKELVQFSNADNVRSIPSVMDGLKPSQRKLLFACFKRGKALQGPSGEIKVAQLSGYCAEQTVREICPFVCCNFRQVKSTRVQSHTWQRSRSFV